MTAPCPYCGEPVYVLATHLHEHHDGDTEADE